MVELINSDPTVLDALVTCDESWIYCYDPETKRQSSQWKYAGFCRKRPALFKLAQWHFHLDNAPVHNSILVTDILTKMGIKTISHSPYSPDLAPYDFCLFPKLKEKLRGCRYETIEEMKEAVTKSMTYSHKRTSRGPSRSCWNSTSALQLEEITSKGTRVSFVYYQ